MQLTRHQARTIDAASMIATVRDALRPVSVAYLCWLLLAACFSWLAYFVTKNNPEHAVGVALIVYYAVVLVHGSYRCATGGKAILLRPDIVFILLYTMFHVAYVTLYAIGVVPYATEILRFDSAIPAAMFVCNLGLIGFVFGHELMGLRASQSAAIPAPKVPTDSWLVVGLGIMVVATTMHLGSLAFVGLDVFRRYGYAAVQGIAEHTGYLPALMLTQSIPLAVIGVTIYVVASTLRHKRLFHSPIAPLVLAVFFFLLVLEGDRGPILQLGLPILLARHYLVRRIRLRYLALLFVATMTLFGAIRVVRSVAFAPSAMWQEYQYQRESGFVSWLDPFVEMGSSFVVVNVTCHGVPAQEPYWRGASWGSAALHTVPFLQRFASRAGWTVQSPSKWVTDTYWGPGRAGRAFTVATEGYLNFGFPGAFIEVMGFGLFIRWLTMLFGRSPSGARAFVMFGCLVPSILVIRNHLNIATNICVQIIVVGVLLSLVLGYELRPSPVKRSMSAAQPAL